MSRHLDWILRADQIALHVRAATWEEAIRRLARPLKDRGYVKDSYSDAVVAREREFPTGLLVGDTNVAIPHADAEHVMTSSLAVGFLEYPIKFQRMDDPAESVDVGVVFLLAVANPDEQTDALSKVMDLIRDQDFLKAGRSFRSTEEALAHLSHRL
ncbi:MAG: PTS sugar transporter subunit IIA [Actinobacteria bacterium]|nr:PTS sugar transporter subunit IIA [Actinomycetota bacterium]